MRTSRLNITTTIISKLVVAFALSLSLIALSLSFSASLALFMNLENARFIWSGTGGSYHWKYPHAFCLPTCKFHWQFSISKIKSIIQSTTKYMQTYTKSRTTKKSSPKICIGEWHLEYSWFITITQRYSKLTSKWITTLWCRFSLRCHSLKNNLKVNNKS